MLPARLSVSCTAVRETAASSSTAASDQECVRLGVDQQLQDSPTLCCCVCWAAAVAPASAQGGSYVLVWQRESPAFLLASQQTEIVGRLIETTACTGTCPTLTGVAVTIKAEGGAADLALVVRKEDRPSHTGDLVSTSDRTNSIGVVSQPAAAAVPGSGPDTAGPGQPARPHEPKQVHQGPDDQWP